MQFTQVLGLAAVASLVSAQVANTTVVTKSDIGTTLVTITSCEENKCHETAVTTGVTVVTTTIHGTVTEYTTYCPLTTETTSKAPAPTTVVPKTSNVTSTHSVSTFHGAAAKAVPAVAAVAAGVALLF